MVLAAITCHFGMDHMNLWVLSTEIPTGILSVSPLAFLCQVTRLPLQSLWEQNKPHLWNLSFCECHPNVVECSVTFLSKISSFYKLITSIDLKIIIHSWERERKVSWEFCASSQVKYIFIFASLHDVSRV